MTTLELIFLITGIILLVMVILMIAVGRSGRRNDKNLAQQLENQKTRLDLVLNSVTEAIIAVDQNAYIKIYNAAAMWLLDTNTSLEAQNLSKFVKIVNEKNRRFDFLKELEKRDNILPRDDLSLVYPDGDSVKIRFAAARTTNDPNVAVVLTMRDITQEKALSDERDEFISVVSHELRTPAAVAEGTISNLQFLLEKKADPSMLLDQVKTAHDQIIYLEQMINDIGTLSRANRGVNAAPEIIDTLAFAECVIKDYGSQAAAKKLFLETDFDDKLPEIKVAKLYLQEILQNFLTNAIKYTKEGTVTFSVKAKNDRVEFAVTDTGIGIGRGDLPRIFDKFFRSEDFRTRESSGAGLGLYVTAKLAKLIETEIEVDSELGKGSTFRFELPVHKKEEDAAPTKTAVSQPTKK